MKKIKLMMMAALLAFAGTAMAQGEKKTVLVADGITIANGEDAVVSIRMADYQYTPVDDEDGICGVNLYLSLPDGLLLKSFDTKEDQDKAKASAVKKNFSLTDEDGIWDDPDDAWLNKAQITESKDILVVVIDQDDKTAFDNLNGIVVNMAVHAVADVKGQIRIYDIALTNTKNVSVDLNNIAEYNVGVNEEATGINEVKSVDSNVPAYNLQGVRVNSAAKGLIIRDGKKMIVK